MTDEKYLFNGSYLQRLGESFKSLFEARLKYFFSCLEFHPYPGYEEYVNIKEKLIKNVQAIPYFKESRVDEEDSEYKKLINRREYLLLQHPYVERMLAGEQLCYDFSQTSSLSKIEEVHHSFLEKLDAPFEKMRKRIQNNPNFMLQGYSVSDTQDTSYSSFFAGSCLSLDFDYFWCNSNVIQKLKDTNKLNITPSDIFLDSHEFLSKCPRWSPLFEENYPTDKIYLFKKGALTFYGERGSPPA